MSTTHPNFRTMSRIEIAEYVIENDGPSMFSPEGNAALVTVANALCERLTRLRDPERVQERRELMEEELYRNGHGEHAEVHDSEPRNYLDARLDQTMHQLGLGHTGRWSFGDWYAQVHPRGIEQETDRPAAQGQDLLVDAWVKAEIDSHERSKSTQEQADAGYKAARNALRRDPRVSRVYLDGLGNLIVVPSVGHDTVDAFMAYQDSSGCAGAAYRAARGPSVSTFDDFD